MKPLSTFLKIPDPFLNTLPNILINITLYYRILLSIGFAVFLGLVFFIKSTDAETIKVSSDFGYNYANLNSSNAKVAEGRLFFQNEDALVFQFDGLYADVSGLDFKGLGAHYYFYHDTNSMLGISGSRLSGDLVNSGEIAFEGTYNLSKFTLGSKLGYASIKYKQSAPFIDTDLKKAFAMIYLKSIIKETLMVNIAYERRFDLNALSLEAEYFSPINNVSFSLIYRLLQMIMTMQPLEFVIILMAVLKTYQKQVPHRSKKRLSRTGLKILYLAWVIMELFITKKAIATHRKLI